MRISLSMWRQGWNFKLPTARMPLDRSEVKLVLSHLGCRHEVMLLDYATTPDGKTKNVLVNAESL